MRKQERKREGEIKRTERSQHRDDVFEVDKLATEKKKWQFKKIKLFSFLFFLFQRSSFKHNQPKDETEKGAEKRIFWRNKVRKKW